jgi:hypothetical protein
MRELSSWESHISGGIEPLRQLEEATKDSNLVRFWKITIGIVPVSKLLLTSIFANARGISEVMLTEAKGSNVPVREFCCKNNCFKYLS